jgi:hypothetical protein
MHRLPFSGFFIARNGKRSSEIRSILTVTLLAFCSFTSHAEVPGLSTSGYSIQAIGLTDDVHTNSCGYTEQNLRHFNQAGQAVGTSQRWGSCQSYAGVSGWLHTGSETIEIGMTDAQHTSGIYRETAVAALNEAGQVTGSNVRTIDLGSAGGGVTAWLYDGSATLSIGLTDPEHIRGNLTKGASWNTSKYLNEAGQVTGTAERFIRYSWPGDNGQSVWLYDGNTTINVGLTDTDHTQSTDYRFNSLIALNAAGQVAGTALRYPGGSNYQHGSSSWLYDGNSTLIIGLTDSEHTRSDGYLSSIVTYLSDAGPAIGSARRYDGGTAVLGNSTWLYDGSSTLNIGLTDSEHTRASDGYRDSIPQLFNQAGQAVGYARRYVNDGDENGITRWLYNGTTTLKIGLTGSEYTRNNVYYDGYRDSVANFLNEAGQVAGYSYRYTNDGDVLGKHTWLYNGIATIIVGPTDSEHTGSDGFRNSFPRQLNAAGQVIGYADRYVGSGQNAWFYDGESTVSLGEISASSWGYAWSDATFLSDDGIVLGTYRFYDEADDYQLKVFAYSEATGVVDLGLQVDASFDDWQRLYSVLGMSDSGVIFGEGILNDGANSKMAYKLSPAGTQVSIDVLPWSPANNIDPESTALIPVAVLTTSVADGDALDFDAAQVDPALTTFGPANAPNATTAWITDIDGDTDNDIVLGYHSNETGIFCEDSSANLTGQTYSGQTFEGTDIVLTPACPDAGCHP